MRYVTFEYKGTNHAGVLKDDRVLPIGNFPDLGVFFAQADTEHTGDWLTNEAIPIRDVRLRAPIPRPPKLLAVGLNYRSHATEQGKEAPLRPIVFAKSPSAVVGPDDPIRLPTEAPDHVDAEVEMAFVIGRGGFRIRREEALRHVVGITVLNDVTARDVQKEERQWFRSKSFASFAPLGPVIVTPDETDPADVEIRLRRNGEEMQRSRTSDLVFDIPALVEFVSATFPLEAGDIISTGTPGGVGVFRDPPVYLRHGDFLECEMTGLGVLRNPVLGP